MSESVYFLAEDGSPLPEGTPIDEAYWVEREIRDEGGEIVERYTYFGPRNPQSAAGGAGDEVR